MPDNQPPVSSDLEKTNLEVHVDMNRQRYQMFSDKVHSLEDHLSTLSSELNTFRAEHARAMSDLKQSQIQAIATLREEQAQDTQGTIKVVVGAAATIIAGLTSVLVVLLVAFL